MFICFSHVQLFVTLWSITCQASLSMGFSRQEFGMVPIPSSQGSSWPRDWTWVSCNTGRFSTVEPRGKQTLLNCTYLYTKNICHMKYSVGQNFLLFFKVKLKRHSFHFLWELYWTMHKSQLHNIIFSKLFIFLSKELFQVPFIDFQGIDIFFC